MALNNGWRDPFAGSFLSNGHLIGLVASICISLNNEWRDPFAGSFLSNGHLIGLVANIWLSEAFIAHPPPPLQSRVITKFSRN